MVFSGTLTSDYEKLVFIPDAKKPSFIDFGGTDFLNLKDNLFKYISAVYPLDYNRFIESDLGIMFIELIAYMGAVINFKSEFLANENILATVQKTENLKNLLELIGVRLRGPLSAAGDAKLTLDSTPSVFTPAPGQAITLPASDRVITITSPEDGAQVSYSLYKVNNTGTIDISNAAGSLELVGSEADNSTSTVFTNLVWLEGSLGLTSGTFINEDSIKTVLLPQSPVIEGSVEVFIESDLAAANGNYEEVRNVYFASGLNQKIFQVDYGDNFSAKITFGDGNFGISPPTNSNYTITYRVGGGSRGNLLPEVINVNKTWTGGGNGVVENITSITGGSNSETIEHAKKWAPLTFRRQDRCVTLPDYTTFANAFRGSIGTVGKAIAVTRDSFSSANVIDVYILERASNTQLKRATPQFKKELLAQYDLVKMVTDEVVIVDGVIRTLDLIITLFVDKANDSKEEQIKQSTVNSIRSFFNVDNMDFGKELVLAELNRKVFENPFIRYSKIDNLSDNVRVDFNEIIQLNNLTLNVSYV